MSDPAIAIQPCGTRMWHNGFVPSMNIRQLRDTRRLKGWLKTGQTVELREREKVLARIVPVSEATQPDWPDFETRVNEIVGDRVLSGADQLIADRSRY